MNLALFYDCETSGLPLWNDPSEDPRQPHIVQLGARLVDIEARKVISTLDVIVRPDGWEIPAEVSAIHGITTEMAMDVGVSESMALGMLLSLWGGDGATPPRLRVGHNESFDARIIRIAALRYEDEPLADRWKDSFSQCTAKMATQIMKLPPTAKMIAARRNHPKTPNLGEAYRFFTGRELEGAHSALVDVDACMAVFFAIVDGATEPALAA